MTEPEQNSEISQAQKISPPPVQNSNKKWMITLIILVLLGFSSTAALVGYLYTKKSYSDVQSTASSSPLSETAATASSSTPSPRPTLSPNQHGNTFNSSTLGFGFYYSDTMAGSSEKLEVTEDADTVYLHAKGQPKESGQWVRRFTKKPTQTLEAAIEEQLLEGTIPGKCFVSKLESKQTSITKAIIDYPVPENSEEPFYMYGDECPADYRKTNGVRYFYADANTPDVFYFFSLGQYGIPAFNNDANSLWQDTFKAY